MKRLSTKKLVAVALALLMLLPSALAGCAPADEPAESSTPSAPETPAPADSTPAESTPEATEPESTPEETPEATPESTPEETPEIPAEPVKSDFEIYQSNSVTPTACNYALKSENGKAVTKTFRGLFKIQEYGELEYKFFFSNNVDSTFSNGSHSYRNMKTNPFKIISAVVSTTSSPFGTSPHKNPVTITFDGKGTRDVEGGEMFWSDAVKLNVPKGHWLIFEWTVEYTVIAATNSEGVALALFENAGNKVSPVDAAPMPALVGADRGNDLRIAFIGDSITMGIGAGTKNYKGYVAKIAEGLGDNASVWNLALGYARADDAANSPAWVEKAKNNDVLCICFGVNDINSGPYKYSGQRNAVQILNDIKKVAEECSEAGVEIIIFSTPPYTYANSDKVNVWKALVRNLESYAEEKGFKYFDFASLLGSDDDFTKPKYGGHPNATGCAVVADEFLASGLVEVTKD